MLGQRLVTKQTPSDGVLVNTIMIAESVDIQEEKYVCILLDRAENGPVLLASAAGGVDIEAIAKDSPHLLKCYPIDIISGLSDKQYDDIVNFLQFDDQVQTIAKNQIKRLWKMFLATDAIQLEINPLVMTKDHRIICVDAKVVIDDNSKFRQKDIFCFEDVVNEEKDQREVEAMKSNLNYVRLSGNIGCLVNGMYFVDEKKIFF